MRWIRAAYEVKAYRWSGSADAIVNGRWEPEPGDSLEVTSLVPKDRSPAGGPELWKVYLRTPGGTQVVIEPGDYLVSDPLIDNGAWRSTGEARVRERYQQLTAPAA